MTLPEAHLEWVESVGIFEVGDYLIMRKLLKNLREETQQSNRTKLSWSRRIRYLFEGY